MKLVVFGSTGMVGKGVLREALADPDVESVLSIGRRSCGESHPKLKELILKDLFDVAQAESDLSGLDACIWSVGISSIGKDEPTYAKFTEELTLLWARRLLELNPGMSFCYCSAMGADGSTMWARVRRRVEGPLETMGFKNAGVVRPGFIQPGPGIGSQVAFYQFFIRLFAPLFPVLVRALPGMATTSERLGRAMLRIVQGRSDRFILEPADINRIGAP